MTTSPSPLPIDQLIIPCIIFILYTLALLLSAYATIYSVRAILPRIFKALSPQHFYYEPLLKEEPYYIYIAIINSLFLAIEANTKANRIKMELYANGWLWAAISAFSYVMYDIIYNISMKGV